MSTSVPISLQVIRKLGRAECKVEAECRHGRVRFFGLWLTFGIATGSWEVVQQEETPHSAEAKCRVMKGAYLQAPLADSRLACGALAFFTF